MWTEIKDAYNSSKSWFWMGLVLGIITSWIYFIPFHGTHRAAWLLGPALGLALMLVKLILFEIPRRTVYGIFGWIGRKFPLFTKILKWVIFSSIAIAVLLWILQKP